MSKNQEILKQRSKSSKLRKEIKVIKEKVPKQIGVILLIGTVLVLLFENMAHNVFGSAIGFIIITSIIFLVISIVIFFKNFIKIQEKEKEIKNINNVLYGLMRLEEKNKNE